MKYCPHCCTLFKRGAVCPECKRELKKEIRESDPVTVVKADGFERERIVAALRDNGVPCVEQFDRKERSADAVTGKLAARVKIQVPYAALEQAKDILIGIGALAPGADDAERESMPEGAEDHSAKAYQYSHAPKQGTQQRKGKKKKRKKEPAPEPQWEEMPRLKRNIVRIVSAILFIIVVALVIFGTDLLTGFIKGLF